MIKLRCKALYAAGVMLVCGAAATADAQAGSSFLDRWQGRATATQEQQPHWATPVATSTAKLDQAMRAEFGRQVNSSRYGTWNLGNSKGLELIPERHTELIFGVPPFFDHSAPHVKDGFGDVWLQAKFRIYARNEQHGNAAVTAVLHATIPTGKDANGICCATVTPSVAAGKGFGRLIFQGTLGGQLPVTNAAGLGRTVAWNSVAQYHIGETGLTRFLWPEFEVNSTFYHGGANDGKIAAFGTPGLVFGRVLLNHNADGQPGRRALTLAAGEQIALTHFHPYNHALILSLRLPF